MAEYTWLQIAEQTSPSNRSRRRRSRYRFIVTRGDLPCGLESLNDNSAAEKRPSTTTTTRRIGGVA
jgi:hypothetical protein